MEQAAGHGDILEDNDGNWWFAHLAFRQIHMWQTYHHLGREVCLVPVKWRDDGWFEIGVNGTTPIEVELPDNIKFTPQKFSYDKTFENLDEKLDWCYIRIPHMENYKFDKNGLELKGTDVTIDDVASPTFAGIRQTEFDLDINCDVIPGAEKSGISFYMDEKHHYEVVVEKNESGTFVYSRQTIGCIWQESKHHKINADKVTLHIKSEAMQYHFFFKDENGNDVFISDAETRYL